MKANDGKEGDGFMCDMFESPSVVKNPADSGPLDCSQRRWVAVKLAGLSSFMICNATLLIA